MSPEEVVARRGACVMLAKHISEAERADHDGVVGSYGEVLREIIPGTHAVHGGKLSFVRCCIFGVRVYYLRYLM